MTGRVVLADLVSKPTDLVLFGGAGDLARKKLLPALYYLFAERRLPRAFRLIGAGRAEPEGGYADFVRRAVTDEAGPDADAGTLRLFLESVRFAAADAGSAAGLAALRAVLDEEKDRRRAFYAALPPALYAPLVRALAETGLNDAHATLALEKPIGKDLDSAVEINAALAETFPESRVFRIDHYLGKATVQNLLALRFGNAILEPIWTGRDVEHVQITVAEQAGVEGREGYYDGVGALRDMVQNHILQLLCLVAMEPPVRLSGEAVRAEKLKVVRALRPIRGAAVKTETVRGVYEGKAGDPATETFVALTAEVNTWRWGRTPFFLRTGKRLASRASEIVIQFKPAPHSIFRERVNGALCSNRLVIRIQPDERIDLELMSAHAGLGLEHLELSPVSLSLSHAGPARRRRIAYERLIADWLRGDPTLFVGREEVEESWRWIDGVLAGWREQDMRPIPYPAGGWGPAESDAMLARRGARWRNADDDEGGGDDGASA